MINENLRASGTPFAVKRFYNYVGNVTWKSHCYYFGREICRAYHPDGRPCALYACDIDHCVLLVGENLESIKARVKEVVQ